MPKNLFEPVTRAGILQRLNALSAASTRQRGKMDAAQTMVHCSVAVQGHREKGGVSPENLYCSARSAANPAPVKYCGISGLTPMTLLEIAIFLEHPNLSRV